MRIFRATILGIFLATAAGATTIIQTQSFPGTGLGNDVTADNYQYTLWDYTYAFNTFDTTLGTLNLVTISISDGLTGFITVTNHSGTTSTFKGSIADQTDFSLTPNPGALNNFFEDGFNGPLKTIGLLADGASGSTPTQTISSTTGPSDATSFFGLAYSTFETVGAGTFNLYEQTQGQSVVGGPSPYNAAVFTGGQSTVTIEYDYTDATPEPASWSFLVGSVLAIAGLKVRNHAKKG